MSYELDIHKAWLPFTTWVGEIKRWVGKEELKIVDAVRAELLDPEYKGVQHEERSTYRRGCRGPLCRKAQRDYGREHARRARGAKGTRPSPMMKWDPLLEMMQDARRSRALVPPAGSATPGTAGLRREPILSGRAR